MISPTVFENDEKTQGMSDHDRLKYHQKNSKPILDKLKIWMQEQLDQNIVEPGGHFGKVLKYCLNLEIQLNFPLST